MRNFPSRFHVLIIEGIIIAKLFFVYCSIETSLKVGSVSLSEDFSHGQKHHSRRSSSLECLKALDLPVFSHG